MAGEQRDWNDVVEMKPKGYLELNNGEQAVHGPLESIVVDDMDWVVITLKWRAVIPLVGGIGAPDFSVGWKVADNSEPFRMPNFVMPFVVEPTPEKGPRVRFGLNILYINDIPGVDPREVQGLELPDA